MAVPSKLVAALPASTHVVVAMLYCATTQGVPDVANAVIVPPT